MKDTQRRTKVGLMIIGLLSLIIIISASCTGCKLNALAQGKDDRDEGADAHSKVTTKATTTTTAVTTTVITTTLPQVPEFLNPLTGTETSEHSASRRPIAVCIGNTAASMPQYGLGKADILVEAPVEGGITRLMILSCEYASDSSTFGSIRSTRTYLADLAKDFDALQSYAGTSDAGSSSTFSGYDTLDYITQNMTSTYYADPQRNSPHHIMTDGNRLFKGATSLGYRTTYSSNAKYPFEFVDYFEKAILSSNDSLYIRIPFSSSQTTEFKYDAESGSYERYQFGALHTDAESGKALSFTNLFILFCDTTTYDKATGTEISLDIRSGGTGYYVSEGKYMDIIWYRDENSQLKLCDRNGDVLQVNRGKSYIGLVKISSKNHVVLNSK